MKNETNHTAMNTTERMIEEHYGQFNRHHLYSSEAIKELRESGKRLLSVELVGEDVHVLIWTDYIAINDLIAQLRINYHSDSMLKKWIGRSDHLEASEVNYNNYTN